MTSTQAPPIIPNQVLSGIQPGTNVIIIPGYAPTPSFYPRYNGKASMALGITQIVLGALSVLLTGLSISFGIFLSFIGAGIWCAVLYFIAGAFGIAAKGQGRCMVITHMVLSIIAAAFTTIPFALAMTGAVNSDSYYYYDRHHKGLPMNILLAIVSFAELVTAVIASVLCCRVSCGQDAMAVQPQQNVVAGANGVQYTIGENNQLLLQQPGPSQPYPVANMPHEKNMCFFLIHLMEQLFWNPYKTFCGLIQCFNVVNTASKPVFTNMTTWRRKNGVWVLKGYLFKTHSREALSSMDLTEGGNAISQMDFVRSLEVDEVRQLLVDVVNRQPEFV